MNASPSPSAPPRGVRDLIATMRARPLPRRSPDEIERLRQYIKFPGGRVATRPPTPASAAPRDLLRRDQPQGVKAWR